MKISGMFFEMAAEIYNSGYDEDITPEQEAEILAAMEAINEEATDAEEVMAAIGEQVDGWAPPMGVCILGLIKRIFGS